MPAGELRTCVLPRLAGAASRRMMAFQQGMVTLDRLRSRASNLAGQTLSEHTRYAVQAAFAGCWEGCRPAQQDQGYDGGARFQELLSVANRIDVVHEAE